MALSVISNQTVIAAFAGAFATYGAQLLLDRRKEKRQAENFRRSLRAELIQLSNFSEIVEEIGEEGEFSLESLLILSTADYPFFKSNQDKLSLLTEIEQIQLVRFYRTHEHFRLLAERMLDQVMEQEGVEGMTDLPMYVEMFNEEREKAISEIEENI